MPSEVILYGPDSMPYALAGDVGNNNNNVAAAVAVAGVTGVPQGPYALGQQLVLRDGRKFRYVPATGKDAPTRRAARPSAYPTAPPR